MFYDDVTTGASEPADESIKLIKYQVYHFSQHNIRQQLLAFSLKFKS